MKKTPAETTWRLGALPSFFDAGTLECDVATLRADACALQSCARLEAARTLSALAPDLFGAEALDVVTRFASDTGLSLAATHLKEKARFQKPAPPQGDYSCPPPRMPFLVEKDAHPLASFLAVQPLQLEALAQFLRALPETVWGSSLLAHMGVPAEAFVHAAGRAALFSHPGFEGACACYAFEALQENDRDVDAIFIASRPAQGSLWAHEAAHLAHAVALRAAGESPFLTPDVDKETAGLCGELLCLAQLSWEDLGIAVQRGDKQTLSSLAFWWQHAIHAGGPYVPAAWRLWNAVRKGEAPPIRVRP